jgi:hypothetical protein
MTECGWYFDELSQKESRQGDIPTKHALDADISTFVREVLQNANDAGPVDAEKPIEVTFRFQHLERGDGLGEFEEAFQWDDELRAHLEGAAEEEQDLSLHQFLENETDDLVLLTIEDKNTVGLSGAEDADESNYTALVRDMHRSNKDETEGGSHGVGGTVLWAFSGISTVLFCSNPVELDDEEPPRFVGRSYLPDHTVHGELHKGYGWFGRPDPDDSEGRHISLWGEDAKNTATALGTVRPDEYGTSSTVVGFREPGEPQPTGDALEDMIDDIQTAAVENFWPAIRRQRLQVYVEGPRDDEPRPADFQTIDEVQPFRDAYESLYSADGELGEPGATANSVIEFDFPDRSDGSETPETGEATLSVRTADPSDEEFRNKVAVFRGAGMVVQYVDMDDVAKYGSDFHAVLACGEARTELGEEPSFVDRNVEQLLRAAEPAAHNKWTGTPRLKNEYSGRRVGTVKDLQGGLLRDDLRELVAEDDGGAGERLESFEKLFPTGRSGAGGGGGGTSPPSVDKIERDLHELVFEDDHWEFELTLRRTEEGDGWRARVWLTQLFEDGGEGEKLQIDDVTPLDGASKEDVQLDDGVVDVRGSGSGSLRLRCSSARTGPPDPTSGRTARTGVRHELVAGGDSS